MCGRLMSPAHETQSMWEIRLLRRRLPRKGGGLTGMLKLERIVKMCLSYWKFEPPKFCNFREKTILMRDSFIML